MYTAIIILSCLVTLFIGVIVGICGTFAVIGMGKRPPPVPPTLAERLRADLGEIPENWKPGEEPAGGGLAEEGSYSIDPNEN